MTSSPLDVDAVELLRRVVAARSGGESRPGQERMAELVAESFNTGEHLLAQAGTGVGKALSVETPIPTPSGWKRMGDLVAGDVVFDESGAPTEVVAAFDVLHGRQCYEVEFSDGTTLVADAEHEWVTATRAARGRRYKPDSERTTYGSPAALAALQAFALASEAPVPISELVAAAGGHDTPIRSAVRSLTPVGTHPDRIRRNAPLYDRAEAVEAVLLRLGAFKRDQRSSAPLLAKVTTEEMRSTLLTKQGAANHAVPVAGALELPEAELPLAPYLLGAWLGDGTAKSAGITSVDPEVLDAIRSEGYVVTTYAVKKRHSIHLPGGPVNNRWVDSVQRRLRELGVHRNKHIPVSYLRSSRSQRTALLQGLMDTDGTVGNGSLHYDGTNERLVRDVYELVTSLGYRAQLTSGPATMKRPDGTVYTTTSYAVCFMTNDPVFRLPRKLRAQEVRAENHNGTRTRYRYVTAVRPVLSRPVRCIQVAAESHLYLAGRSMVPTHNSMAYLVPSVLAAARAAAADPEGERRRVVVATATKALQEQLIEKDLPELETALAAEGIPFSFGILKGRSNYLCRARLADVQTNPTFDIADELEAVSEWAELTGTGDQAEASFSGLLWSRVSVSAGECPGASACPFGDVCFAEEAKAAAAGVDVLVVNLALYAAHLASGGRVLPSHDWVVLDEAHVLPDVVADAFGVRLSSSSLLRLAQRLEKLVPDAIVSSVRDSAAAFDSVLLGLDGIVDVSAEPLASVLLDLRAVCGEARRAAEGVPGQKREESTLARLQQAARTAEAVAGDIERLALADDSSVVWVESESKIRRSLRLAPVDVGPILASSLFPGRTVVATSATLAFAGRFDALAKRWGLLIPRKPAGPVSGDVDAPPPAPVLPRWRSELVESPFDYRRNAYLYVPQLPDPRSDAFPDAAHAELHRLVTAAGGRTLGLFTSFKAMNEAAAALRELSAASEEPYRVLVQGEASRYELLADFTSGPGSVLLANQSFWTGVDIPGAACTLVVIAKLPFTRPNEPLAMARRAAVERAGGNPFMELDVPHAAAALAQGVGRLIRSSTDRGVVAVFDRRLVTARYGELILDSLPPLRRVGDPVQVAGALRWLHEEELKAQAAGASPDVSGDVVVSDVVTDSSL